MRQLYEAYRYRPKLSAPLRELTLNRLVAFELKVVEFEPGHLGKLEFYLQALDRDVKKPRKQDRWHEGPTEDEKNISFLQASRSQTDAHAVPFQAGAAGGHCGKARTTR